MICLKDLLMYHTYRHQLHSNTEVWEKIYNWQLNSELLEFIDFLKKNSSKSGLMDTLQKVTDVLNANPASNTTLAAWTDGYIKLYNLMGEVSEEIKGLALVNFHKKIINDEVITIILQRLFTHHTH